MCSMTQKLGRWYFAQSPASSCYYPCLGGPQYGAPTLQDVSQPADECRAGTGGPRLTWEPVDGLFIVRFKAYRMAAAHRDELTDGLKDVREHWQWVDRDNKAAQYPTDFGLLRIASSARQAVEVGTEG